MTVSGVRVRIAPSPTGEPHVGTAYIALFNYGYKNVYELAPLIDPEKSKLEFESAEKK